MNQTSIKGVVTLNSATFATLTLTETKDLIEWVAKMLLLVLTIALTARKWWIVEKSAKDKKLGNTEHLSRLPVVAALSLFLLTGCTFAEKARSKITGKADTNRAAIAEESAALTTGVNDALALAPTNAPTDLARTLARADQQLEGLPKKRIPVEAVLGGDKAAIAALESRLKVQDGLIAEKTALEAKLREREAALLEMGAKYEAEKNRSFVKRFWLWTTSTFGLLGGIAFIVFCPAIALPLLSRVIAWTVSAIPAAAKLFGVVGKGAWDSVVRGVEDAKAEMPMGNRVALEAKLSRTMDTAHKKLVRVTKSKLSTQPA